MNATPLNMDRTREYRAWARRSLPWLLGLLLTGALAALLYSAGTASRDHDKALNEQRSSLEVIALVRQFDATSARAETTLARYVISMDVDTGRLFQSQLRAAASQLRRMAFVTRRSGWQQDNVEQLAQAFGRRSKTLNDVALRTTYDQKMAALSHFHAAGKAPEVARIAALLDTISDAEQQRLKERSLAVSLAGDRTERAGQTSRLLGLALLVSILFAIWIAQFALAERRAARRLAEDEGERADRLEAAVAQRTTELRDANERLKQEASEREAAESHLRQMHKMEAVGQLTGGIAHDFNNMLAVVVGGLELARRKLRLSPEEANRHIDNAIEGANRASALTRRLLAFARSEPLLPTMVDPDTLVSGMGDLIDRTIGDQIAVELRHRSGGWHVFVDQHQMENAILNLCVNARDAMDGRGTLTIETGQAVLGAGEVGECSAGDYATLTVRDNGCGMTPEIMARVFEPFFTTKPVGKGTGLGLSQIFGFVRQSQGEIRVESEVGRGTAIHIYLPRQTMVEAEGLRQSAAAPQEDTRHPPTRILVVEDDPRVLNQTLAAIAELGHLPLSCDHPSKVVRLLANHGDIGLIVSDVLMPDMTGPEMIRALPAAFRHIPVLFVTGYAGDISDAEAFGGHEVLRKPYTLAGLSRALSTALSEQRQSGTAAAAE
ncbi:ATP-binding protein [Sphingobium sp. AN641]|uniref:ATP-binding protein n=1 Tax=Sphingobium sp. AN641 TaxID=3133443 RepID=UPI0030C338DA